MYIHELLPSVSRTNILDARCYAATFESSAAPPCGILETTRAHMKLLEINPSYLHHHTSLQYMHVIGEQPSTQAHLNGSD